MGLSPNDQNLIKHLLGQKLINAEAVVRLTLLASEKQCSFLQAVLDSQSVDPQHLRPFLPAQSAAPVHDDDMATVVNSESQRLAQSSEGAAPKPPGLPVPLPPPPPQSSLPRPNSRFGPYMLYEMIGQGGMGMVFRAKQVDLDRDCAVKILVAQENAIDESLLRFIAEAKTFAQLDQHPHIVRVIDAGQVGRSYYISMELVDGLSLREAVKKTQLSVKSKLQYAAQIADALVAVHRRGIIHRDIKPGNILVSADGAKLTDFGIAKNKPQADGLTLTGSVLGTLAYMPPEQAEDSKDIDARADIYSLGAVLYFALTGRAPHVGASGANVIASLLTRPPERPRTLNPKIPVELEKIVLRAMARKPSERFQSAAIFRDKLLGYLETCAEDGSLPQRPRVGKARSRQTRKKASGLPAVIGSIVALIGMSVIALTLLKQQDKTDVAESDPQGKVDIVAAKILSLNLKADQWVSKSTYELRGQVNSSVPQLTVTVDGQSQDCSIDENNAFVATLKLSDGLRELKIYKDRSKKGPELIARRFQVDTQKPKLVLPELPKQTEKASLLVKGTVEEKNLKTLSLNGQGIPVTKGAFEAKLSLVMGQNSFSLTAVDQAGLKTTLPLKIERLALNPTVSFSPYPSLIRKKSWLLKGTVTPKEAELSFQSRKVSVTEGAFSIVVQLKEGKNEFDVSVSHGGKSSQQKLSMTLDTQAPEFTIVSPAQPFQSKDPQLVFLLKSKEEARFQLTIGAQKWSSPGQSYQSSFRQELTLKDGQHSYTVAATDKAGNQSEKSGTVLVDRSGPVIDFEIDWKRSGTSKLALKGTVTDLSKITVFKVGGRGVSLKKGAFYVKLPRSRLKTGLYFEAEDELGNKSKRPVQFDLVLLNNREKWQKAGKTKEGRKLQDFEIKIVTKRLGKAFQYLGSKQYSCGGQSHRIATFRHKKTAMEFNLIPGGQFLMGNKNTPIDMIAVSPQCSVTLTPFLMGRFSVKQKEWRIYETSILPNEQGPELPMSRMSWLDISEWFKKAGDGLRLPSESEWEYACRAGTTSDYYWGALFDQSYVWSEANAGGAPKAGALHEKSGKWNAFGLIDMIGNLWEWVADSASAGYDVIPPPKDGRPYKQARSNGYMNRGGYWGSKGIELKQWFRDSTKDDKVSNQLGARFAVSIPDK